MNVTLSITSSALPSQVAEYKRTWSRTTPGCLLAGATTRTVEEMDWTIIGWSVDAGWEPEGPVGQRPHRPRRVGLAVHGGARLPRDAAAGGSLLHVDRDGSARRHRGGGRR